MTALADLYRRAPMGMRLGLEPMKEACARAGHPERDLRAIHVAGTNGKGSVCAMLESIARASGLRTGLYTSPHLCKFAERIRIGGEPIDDATLERHLADALKLGPELSFFEAATLAAFLALRAAKVDLAILEVGLGGRLDATNVVPSPLACGVARIALDHTDLLGNTLESIAFEKASIAKKGVPLLAGENAPEVLAVIRKTAEDAGAEFISVRGEYNGAIGLAGSHQKRNAMLAWHLARRVGIDEAACAKGIASVKWPGRLETIGDVLLDAAHNPDGARTLARELRDTDALVFGALADKAWPEMIDILAPRTRHRVYTTPKGRVPADPQALAVRHPGAIAASPMEAVAMARTMASRVVVCGSLYLVGEVRAALLGLPRDPPVAL